MKKLFLTIVCLLAMSSFGWALTFHNANQATLMWNAVTTDVDGDPITGMQYRLYLVNADTDPTKTNPVLIADGLTDTTETITLGTKGRFYVGVSAYLDDLESEINWADEEANQETVGLFGLRFAVPPHAPKNIKR